VSQAAYAHAFTASGDHAAAFCRVVSALTHDVQLRVSATRWGVRGDEERTVTPDELPRELAKLYTPESRVGASFAASLPSEQLATLRLRLTGPGYAAHSRQKAGPLVLVAANNPFLRYELSRPRFAHLPDGMAAAILERRARTDIAWVVHALWRALEHPPTAPVSLAWEAGSWPLAADSFAVHWPRAASYVRDFGIAWLEAHTPRQVNDLVQLGKAELRGLVASERAVSPSKPRTEGLLAALAEPRERVLALLDCDDASVEAAIGALGVLDAAALELEATADEGLLLLANALDLDDARSDEKERWRRWPTVPAWRVLQSDLGVTVVTTPSRSLGEFYATLSGLLLDD